MHLSIISIVLVILIGGLKCRTIQYDFDVYYFSGSPDGVLKNILGVNEMFPGPTIRASLHDYLIVNVKNSIQSKENISIHWHGLEQFMTPFQDGVFQVTQCPLVYGESQTYEFYLLQSGTYWWHSHHAHQYTEGCWGALIVESRLDPHLDLYDDEIVLALSDWYHIPGGTLAKWYMTQPGEEIPPTPDSALINGFGQYNCSFAQPQGHNCDEELQFYPVFFVNPGKAYRIRIINTSAIVRAYFSIDEHDFTVIEIDGVDTVQVGPVNKIRTAPGERYSVVLTTDSTTASEFWIRFDVIGTYTAVPNINPYPESFQKTIFGILRYTDSKIEPNLYNSARDADAQAQTTAQAHSTPHQGRPPFPQLPPAPVGLEVKAAPKIIPNGQFNQMLKLQHVSIAFPSTEPDPNEKILDEMDCQPYDQILAPDYYNQTIQLDFNLTYNEDGYSRAIINDNVFQEGQVPVIYQIINGVELAKSANAIQTVHGDGQVIQLILNGGDGRRHPFHLHGHSFYVLGTGTNGDAYFDPERDSSKLRLDGVRRDMVLVDGLSWVVLRYYAHNPGVWMFHCHINWHHQAGLAVIFVEGTPELIREKFGEGTKRSVGDEICGRAGIDIS